jgi:hypothetical protein
MALASQGFNFHEDFCHPIPDILIVHSQWLPPLAGDRHMDFAYQLLTGLIHANYR